MGLYDSVVNNEYNKQRYQYQLSQLFTSISWGTGCTGETRCSLTHPPPPPTTKSPLQKAEKTVSVDSPFYLDLLGHRVYRGYQVFPNPPNPPPPPAPTTKSPLQKAERTVSVDSPFHLDLLGHRVYRGGQVFPKKGRQIWLTLEAKST